MEGLKTAVGKPTVKSRRYGSDGILKEGQALFDVRGIKGSCAHEDVLSCLLAVIRRFNRQV